jgi:hypothetical protein
MLVVIIVRLTSSRAPLICVLIVVLVVTTSHFDSRVCFVRCVSMKEAHLLLEGTCLRYRERYLKQSIKHSQNRIRLCT